MYRFACQWVLDNSHPTDAFLKLIKLDISSKERIRATSIIVTVECGGVVIIYIYIYDNNDNTKLFPRWFYKNWHVYVKTKLMDIHIPN